VRFTLLLLTGIGVLLGVFPLRGQDKPRVFIAMNATRRSQGYKDPIYRDSTSSIEDRTVEISQDFSESCKEVTVNANRKKADYIVRFSWLPARSRIAVYRADGDLVGGSEKMTVAGAVKAACDYIKKDEQKTALPDSPK